MRIIGVVGPIASGKGTLVRYLEDKEYTVISLSDVVRERAKEWGLEITRENLQNVGDRLRKNFRPSILAEMIAPILRKNSNKMFVIDAIRNPAEILFLQKEFGAYIIGVTADAKKRFENMRKRGNGYDPTSWEDFQEIEARDRGVRQEDFGQQVEKCLAMANIVLENDGSVEELQKKIERIFDSKLSS